MSNPHPQEWHRLFSAALNDTLSEAEKVELSAVLKASAEARQLWFIYTDNECSLSELKPGVKAPVLGKASGRSWFGWRSLTAAAAGVAIGLFSASLVFAYASPAMLKRVLTLANAGFEGEPAPAADGIPLRFGIWSGDYTEVVGAQEGVVPREGTHMLRFLRSDHAGSGAEPSFNANVYQLVDVREWREAIASGTAVVDWSTWFNCARGSEPKTARYEASVWAFAGETSFVRKNWQEKLHQELAYSSWKIVSDEDPSTWQRIAGSMIVPPDTDFLVIELKAYPAVLPPTGGVVAFSGHYADDAQIVLRTDARPARSRGAAPGP